MTTFSIHSTPEPTTSVLMVVGWVDRDAYKVDTADDRLVLTTRHKGVEVVEHVLIDDLARAWIEGLRDRRKTDGDSGG